MMMSELIEGVASGPPSAEALERLRRALAVTGAVTFEGTTYHLTIDESGQALVSKVFAVLPGARDAATVAAPPV